MDSNLQLLIKHLEAEQERLQKEIDQCVQDWNYLTAHYLSQNLFGVKRKLRILETLDHTNSLKIKTAEKKIELLKQRLEEENRERRKKILQIHINKAEQALQQLQKDSATIPYKDSQLIDDALFDLIENKINGFKLYLEKKSNFYFEFELFAPNILSITLTPKVYLTNDHWIHQSFVKKLKKLGFYFNDEKQLIYKYKLKYFKNTIEIKQFLSVIIFEIYTPKDFEDEMFLEKY